MSVNYFRAWFVVFTIASIAASLVGWLFAALCFALVAGCCLGASDGSRFVQNESNMYQNEPNLELIEAELGSFYYLNGFLDGIELQQTVLEEVQDLLLVDDSGVQQTTGEAWTPMMQLGSKPATPDKIITYSFPELNHMLVQGQPRSGKSVLARSLLYQLLSIEANQETKNRIQVGYIDWTGVTFNSQLLGNCPGVNQSMMCDSQAAIGGWFEAVEAEVDRRQKLFQEQASLPEKLTEYNQVASNPEPFIVLFLEEYAAMAVSMGKRWQDRFVPLVWRAPKYGIYIVALTQDATKAVVGPARDAFLTRIAIRDIQDTVSAMFQFRKDAKLTSDQAGRMWLKNGRDEMELQGLWIDKTQLIELVTKLKQQNN